MEITALFAIEAEELLDQGKIDEAIDLCLKGLDAFPDYPSGKIVLARAYKMSGQEDKVEESFQKVMDSRPKFKMLKSIKEKNFEVPKSKVIDTPLTPEEPAEEILEEEIPESIEADQINLVENSEEFQNQDIILESQDENNTEEDNISEENPENDEIIQTVEELIHIEEEPGIVDIESEIDDQLKEIESQKEKILSTEFTDDENDAENDFDLKNAFDELDKQVEEIEINSKDINLISGLKSIPKINVSISEIDKPKISRIKLPEIATPEIIKKKSLSGDKDFLHMSLKNIREEGALEELGIVSKEQEPTHEIPVTIVSEDYDFEVFTETIADIYKKQGAIKKAKEVFEKLIEMHPDQKAYYKERIKSL